MIPILATEFGLTEFVMNASLPRSLESSRSENCKKDPCHNNDMNHYSKFYRTEAKCK